MFRASDIWFKGYLDAKRRRETCGGTRHLLFCVADHFEPFHAHEAQPASRASFMAKALERTKRWVDAWPSLSDGLPDSGGRPPAYTFFYPAEQYDPAILDMIAGLCRKSHTEVEVHLHHRDDTSSGFRQKLEQFRDALHGRHGLLGTDKSGRPRYGFIHGNWSLCNSRPDGDWCGVNDELGILAETGCYADFTFPSAPSRTQPRIVNAIYRASDLPGRPRGHDRGELARARGMGVSACGVNGVERRIEQKAAKGAKDTISLLLVQGPLGLNWRHRKWFVMPHLENAEISRVNPPSEDRVRLWGQQDIHVVGRPEWVFVKVHAHGCNDANMEFLLGGGLRQCFENTRTRYNDDHGWKCHWVSAREMYNIVRAAEDGQSGDPDQFREYEIKSTEGGL